MIKKEIELDDAIIGSAVKKKPAARSKNSYTYETVISSGCDFAIKKSGKASEKMLVCYFSKDIFCILDLKKGTKKTITEPKEISAFFSDKLANDIVFKAEDIPYLLRDVRKDFVIPLFKVIFDNKKEPAFKFAIRKNLLKLIPSCYVSDYLSIDLLKQLYEENALLLTIVLESTQNTFERGGFNLQCANFAISVFRSFGIDTTREILKYGWLPHFKLNSITDFSQYNLNNKRFSEYMTNEMMQCVTCDTYADYLNIRKTINPVIPDKYPKYVESAHTKAMTELNENTMLHTSYPEFEEVVSETRDYTYDNHMDDFVMVMPKTSMDLVKEGQSLGHCVSTYAPKVIAGDCMIVFMRQRKDRETSYLTVEVTKDKYVTEIEGACKRTDLTDDEIVFIKAFARRFNLEITVPNALRSVVRKKSA